MDDDLGGRCGEARAVRSRMTGCMSAPRRAVDSGSAKATAARRAGRVRRRRRRCHGRTPRRGCRRAVPRGATTSRAMTSASMISAPWAASARPPSTCLPRSLRSVRSSAWGQPIPCEGAVADQELDPLTRKTTTPSSAKTGCPRCAVSSASSSPGPPVASGASGAMTTKSTPASRREAMPAATAGSSVAGMGAPAKIVGRRAVSSPSSGAA